MCGINGIISFRPESKTRQIENMNDAISHRGPNSSASWFGENIQLGHLRLAIIDLAERSNQPFQKNNHVLVFNGEIYNFAEIKKELSDVQFITKSDTELVLEAWIKWGAACLSKFRGMFAFAIHDCTSGQTTIVRDPFGIKPLFYYHSKDEFILSSELKAITCALKEPIPVSMDALTSVLFQTWIPESQCIFENIRKLLPGHLMVVSKTGTTQTTKYFDTKTLLQSAHKKIKNVQTGISKVESALLDSVSAHLTSDVPINAFLSGGLDSSLLVAMARPQLESLDCYTIKFSTADQAHEAMTDDFHYAKMVAKHLNVNLNCVEVSPNLAELLPKIVHHLDEPIGDSAAISTFLICDSAHKNGVKVLLSGMGADEIFGGYRKHKANLLARTYRKLPGPLQSIAEQAVGRMPVANADEGFKLTRWAKRFLSFAGYPAPEAFMRSYSYYDPEFLRSIFVTDVAKSIEKLVTLHQTAYTTAHKFGAVDAMCYVDVSNFMVSLNETYTDRASMAASTEVRVPFIDKTVIQTAFEISGKLKITSRHQKYILKKVAEKWLPHDVIYRPKSSFTLPLRSWIKNDLEQLVKDYLLASDGMAGRNIIAPDFLKKLIYDEQSGVADNSQRIWQLLTLEQWFRLRQG